MIANVYIGNIATATGTADVITASYVPAPTVLADKMILYFRATAANATTTPTFSPNGLTAHTIVKQGGTALAAGDIPAVGAVMEIVYDEANTRWELLNPATGNRLYKVYFALLNQNATNAPVEKILENTIGTLTWTYVDVGKYNVATSALFTLNKTAVLMTTWSDGISSSYLTQFQIIDTSNIEIYISLYDNGATDFAGSNGALNNTPIEIRVYY